VRPLDLDRPRDYPELFRETFGLWFRHFGVFFALAAIVVVPVDALVLGVWAGTLGDVDASPTGWALVASSVADYLLIPALVTAMHVLAVEQIGRGERPSIRRSVAGVGRVAIPVVAVVTLYLLGCAVGLVLLIAPGVWFAVAGYFGAQVAVVEGLGTTAALKRSVELVKHNWWRVFGIQLVIVFVGGLAIAIVGVILGVVVDEVVGGGWAVAALAIYAALASLVALVGTLLFFDLRARHAPSWVESPEALRSGV
jgi:hypothetical protein